MRNRAKEKARTICECGGPAEVYKDHDWCCNRCVELDRAYRAAEKRRAQLEKEERVLYELSPPEKQYTVHARGFNPDDIL